MAKKDDRERPFSFRAPAGEGAKLRAELKARGISFNALVTSLIYGKPLPRGTRTPALEKQMLAQLLAHSGATRDALDEALRVARDDARVAEAVEKAAAELEVIATAVMKMMGRGP